MPGNAGGAKGPDFWCAFEDGEVEVIGDEPDNKPLGHRKWPLLRREPIRFVNRCVRGRSRFSSRRRLDARLFIAPVSVFS